MKQIQNTDLYTLLYIQTYTHIFNFDSFCFKIAPCVKMEKKGEYSSIVVQWLRIPRMPMQEMQVQPLGQEDPLGKANDNTLQYSCLENSMGRGTGKSTVCGVTKSRK